MILGPEKGHEREKRRLAPQPQLERTQTRPLQQQQPQRPPQRPPLRPPLQPPLQQQLLLQQRQLVQQRQQLLQQQQQQRDHQQRQQDKARVAQQLVAPVGPSDCEGTVWGTGEFGAPPRVPAQAPSTGRAAEAGRWGACKSEADVKRELNSGNGAGVKRELRGNSPADESAQKRPRRLPGRSQTWPWEASERGNGHGEHLPSSAHSWDGASPLDAAPSAVEAADSTMNWMSPSPPPQHKKSSG